MTDLILSLSVLALGWWLQKKFDSKPLVMSREWKASVLPYHVKEEKRNR